MIREALERPAIRQLALATMTSREEIGQLVEISEVEHVRAVEVRRAIAAAQVQRIVAVVEEAQGALLVESHGNRCRKSRPADPWLKRFSTWACRAL